MGERPDQIERHIQHQRDELGDNINELEQKVKSAFAWRSQFDEHPGAMLGAAFAGGVLLAAILPTRSSTTSRVTARRRSFNEPYSPYTHRDVAEAGEAASPPAHSTSDAPHSGSNRASAETWDTLKKAAIGLATTRLSDYIEELVPGFAEHYQKAASAKRATAFSSAAPYHAAAEEKSWQKPNGGTDFGSHS